MFAPLTTQPKTRPVGPAAERAGPSGRSAPPGRVGGKRPSQTLASSPAILQRKPNDDKPTKEEQALLDKTTSLTDKQKADIQTLLNPQQGVAAAQGKEPEKVTEPDKFQKEMVAEMQTFVEQYLAAVGPMRPSDVELGKPAILDLADLAQSEASAAYAPYIKVTEAARRKGATPYVLRDHTFLLTELPADLKTTVQQNWVRWLMNKHGQRLLEKYRVLGQEGGRDNALFVKTRDAVLAKYQSDIARLLTRWPAFEAADDRNVFIQPRISRQYGESETDTTRRGRWETLGATLHEMLHALAHEKFRAAADALENRDLLIEGAAELLTRPIYDDLKKRAAGDDALRAKIEGSKGKFDAALAPSRNVYADAVKTLNNDLMPLLSNNIENLKAAYFLGRTELIGISAPADKKPPAPAGKPKPPPKK